MVEPALFVVVMTSPPPTAVPFPPPVAVLFPPPPKVELPKPEPAPVGIAVAVVVYVDPWLSVVVITTPPGTRPPTVEVTLLPEESFPVASTIVLAPEGEAVEVTVLVTAPEPDLGRVVALEPAEDAEEMASNATSVRDHNENSGDEPTNTELGPSRNDCFLVGICRARFIGAIVDAIAKLVVSTQTGDVCTTTSQ